MSKDTRIASFYPASSEGALEVLALPVTGDYSGRTGWQWITLADGSLAFGCFPHGLGLEMLEDQHIRDHSDANAASEVHMVYADLDHNALADREPKPSPARSPEYQAALNSVIAAERSLRDEFILDVKRLMPEGVGAVLFHINDTPRLAVAAMLDTNGCDVTAEYELTAAYEMIDDHAIDMGVTTDDEAGSFLDDHGSANRLYAIWKNNARTGE
jgi:hypothetical protein